LNTFSIGFVSLEASRPSTQEKSRHPEWREVNLIHRRWKLLEVSVVPIPCNEDAVGVYLRKGRRLPSFLWLPSPLKETTTMDAGSAEHTQPTVAEPPVLAEKALAESNGAAGGYAAADAEGRDREKLEPDSTEDSAAEQAEPIGRGHFVHWEQMSGMPPGCGKVVSVHKAGQVPGAENQLEAFEDQPAARVKVYRTADDIHHYLETDRYVGVHLEHLTRMDTIAHVPGRKSVTIVLDEHGVSRLFRDRVDAGTDAPVSTGPVVEAARGAFRSQARPDPPNTIPPFRTRAQVLAGMELRIRAQLDPEAVAAEARRKVVEETFGIV
jgi:hypothetical protein